jgi:hypothetical protein
MMPGIPTACTGQVGGFSRTLADSALKLESMLLFFFSPLPRPAQAQTVERFQLAHNNQEGEISALTVNISIKGHFTVLRPAIKADAPVS